MNVVSASQFADSCQITVQAARKALHRAAQGMTWRGHNLPVVELKGQCGGNSGKVWALRLDVAPPAIRDMFDVPATVVEQPLKRPFKPAINTVGYETQAERLALLTPILETAPRSPERDAAYSAAAAKSGKTKKTLMNWMAAWHKSGPAILMPSERADKGRKRVLLSRAWDSGVGLPDAAKESIANDLARNARSMIANDGTSRREVIRLSEITLQRLSAKAGSPVLLSHLPALCKLNDKWAKPFEKYRLIHFHDKDHKRWKDKEVPRVRRRLTDTPMAILMGDVHYMDIMVEQAGEAVRVRLIAWMDMSSLFTWVTPVFLAKGKGIRQEDVATSLAQVTMCPHGGIPQEYYLDNGSEYAELPRLTARLSVLAELEFGTTLAKPYSATSKGAIEGFFHVNQGLYQSLDGYIGGDRTNKKTANKGRVVAPYRKGLSDLEAEINAITAIYNDRPQSGRLRGLSPVQMLERKISETGYMARVPDADTFDLIFSKQDFRTTRQGCINVGGEQYHGSFFDDLPSGERVEVLIPLRNSTDRLFVRNRGTDLGWAKPLPVFDHADRSGARLQSRMEKHRVQAVRQLRKGIDPDISTFELQKNAVGKTAPDTGNNEAWTYAIDKSTDPAVVELDKQRAIKSRAEKDRNMDRILAMLSKREEASGRNH